MKKTLYKKCLLIAMMVLLGCKSIGATPVPVTVPPADYYEVVVVGTDPEGIAAAVSSARNGKRTLLVDTRDRVGGLFTLGGLNSLDMNYTPDRVLLTQGIFQEFFFALDPINPTGDFWGKRDSFDVLHAEQIFDDMIANEPNITLVMGMDGIQPVVTDDGSDIAGLRLYENGYYRLVQGETYIDATQDGDIAAASGVPYTIGGESINEPNQIQAITQVFKIKNVDWQAMEAGIKANPELYKAENNRFSAWGFLDQMKAYQAVHPNVKVRGLNIGLQDDGSVLINAMQMIGYDPLDPAQIEEAKRVGAAEAVHITDYISKHIPGFENAVYGGVMEELYVRESRHIEGEYSLTITDIMENRDFEDKIAWGSYPVDIQTTSMDNWGYVVGDPAAYSIPFRSIVPKVIDNLLVVGRAASFDSIGFGSVRVVPIGMAIAEAAGVAAAYSVDTDMNFREIAYSPDAIRWIQQKLVQQGAYLENLDIPYNYEGHPLEDAIRLSYRLGLIMGSYDNNLRLGEFVTSNQVKDSITKLQIRAGIELGDPYAMNASDLIVSNLEVGDMLWDYLGFDLELHDKIFYFVDNGILSQDLGRKMRTLPDMTYELMYQLIYELYQYATQLS